jgi:hypothetical protein
MTITLVLHCLFTFRHHPHHVHLTHSPVSLTSM